MTKIMSWVNIGLDGTETLKKFSLEEANDADKIREKFGRKTSPIFLYEDGDKDKEVRIGKDLLTSKSEYVWFTKDEAWQKSEFVQTAIFCSNAVYEVNPNGFLRSKSEFHLIYKVIGLYEIEKFNHQKVLILLKKNMEDNSSFLVLAFKGTNSREDWKENFKTKLISDTKFPGKFHKGFHEIASSIKSSEIIDLALKNDVKGILTCGHSLGGAISSILHMNLLKNWSDIPECNLKRKNIINMTFGAPFFGNERLQKHADKEGFTHRMFHFASVHDIVPSVLSIGHLLRVVEEKIKSVASDASCGISEVLRQLASNTLQQKQISLAVSACENIIGVMLDNNQNYPSISEIKEGLLPSTLQNEFSEHSYVPIGKHVILASGNFELLDISGKLTERILQAAVEAVSENGNLSFKEHHSLDQYMELIKQALDGFQDFPNTIDEMQLNKKTCFIHGLKFSKSLCTMECALAENCFFDTTLPLYEQKHAMKPGKTIFCRTCQEDPCMQNYLFHSDCSDTFHKESNNNNNNNKQKHVVIKLYIPDKINENALRETFEAAHDESELYKYMNTSLLEQILSLKVINFSGLGSAALQLVLKEGLFVAGEVTEFAVRGGEIAENALGATSVGINFGVAALIFAGHFAYDLRKYWSGQITKEQFIRKSLENGGQAVGSVIGGVLGGALGGALAGALAGPLGPIAGPVGAFLGACVGGLLGGYIGAFFTGKIIDISKGEKWGRKFPEEIEKQMCEQALMIFEAMIFLGTKSLSVMNRTDVESCFRKKACIYHPDKLGPDVSEERKETAKKNWLGYLMARDMLLQIIDDPSAIPEEVRSKVEQLFRGEARNAASATDLINKIEKFYEKNGSGSIPQKVVN